MSGTEVTSALDPQTSTVDVHEESEDDDDDYDPLNDSFNGMFPFSTQR